MVDESSTSGSLKRHFAVTNRFRTIFAAALLAAATLSGGAGAQTAPVQSAALPPLGIGLEGRWYQPRRGGGRPSVWAKMVKSGVVTKSPDSSAARVSLAESRLLSGAQSSASINASSVIPSCSISRAVSSPWTCRKAPIIATTARESCIPPGPCHTVPALSAIPKEVAV
jgi:hypothetical protein